MSTVPASPLAPAPDAAEPDAAEPDAPATDMNGTPVTLQGMYEAHFRHVWHTLRRLGVQSRDLEDAAHEVFIIAHRRWDTFDATRSSRAWLAGIAWRVAAGERRRARNRMVKLGFDYEPGAHDQLDAQALTEAAEARALVHQALARLPDPQRDVFVLHELDGLSMPEVAEAVDAPLNTLYSRLRLARKKFKSEVLRLRGPKEVTP